ncbi:MAG: 3-hydroxyacyl-CoA dehydrogenase family protein [Nitrospinales bacterium]
MSEKFIAVIGAGVIGADVALDLSIHNYKVLLKDLSTELLESALSRIKNSYRFTKMMKQKKFASLLDDILKNIITTLDYSEFETVGIVIENITENYEAKKKVFTELKRVCHEDVIYGVNTSCISITKIAALMARPENVVGMHFMNPVPLSKLVEVVRGYHTSDETVKRTKAFIHTLGKTCVTVNDMPGFVTNRVLMMMINECVYLLQDQVAKARDVDTIFKLGFGHKMGPLATADLIGLDTVLNSLSILYESYNDSKYRPCPLLKKMVDAGLLGKKSGNGFFNYKI